MSDQYYSAEEAAQVLGLQVRTVRNYVRDGRLAGARIGKQYRITRAGLEAFVGGVPEAAEQPVASGAVERTVEISSVIQVDGLSAGDADRVANTLAALAAGGAGAPDAGQGSQNTRVEPIYDAARARLKVIVVGDVAATIEVIRTVEALTR